MKRFLAVCLMVVVVMAMGVSAFAATNGFVSSPSANKAPELIASKGDGVVVTPFSDRGNLPEESRTEIESAYDSIRNADAVADLNPAIKDKATKFNANSLAVSDFFYIASESDEFDATLGSDAFKNFVCLMKYDGNAWSIVEDAKLTSDGHLQFSGATSATYAVVVGTAEAGTDTPQTGDNGIVYICAAAMVVSAVAIVLVLKKSKKQSI